MRIEFKKLTNSTIDYDELERRKSVTSLTSVSPSLSRRAQYKKEKISNVVRRLRTTNEENRDGMGALCPSFYLSRGMNTRSIPQTTHDDDSVEDKTNIIKTAVHPHTLSMFSSVLCVCVCVYIYIHNALILSITPCHTKSVC
eukprot:GHVR01133623.1.p1 GENE.GHVR01133623.1~~GHVR01133623.1.p1  ORF type:complete len:142 (-),score=39.03 GHVR01133623.1:43-468(-)